MHFRMQGGVNKLEEYKKQEIKHKRDQLHNGKEKRAQPEYEVRTNIRGNVDPGFSYKYDNRYAVIGGQQEDSM